MNISFGSQNPRPVSPVSFQGDQNAENTGEAAPQRRRQRPYISPVERAMVEAGVIPPRYKDSTDNNG